MQLYIISSGFLEVVVGSLGAAVGRVGLLSLMWCTLLRAGVDGFF